MIYKVLFWVFAGIVAGIFITLKWISPPDDDIVIGKIKIKGRNNRIDRNIISGDRSSGKKRRRRLFNWRKKKNLPEHSAES